MTYEQPIRERNGKSLQVRHVNSCGDLLGKIKKSVAFEYDGWLWRVFPHL